jgi:integrase
VAHTQRRPVTDGTVRYDVRWRIAGRERQRSFARARDAEAFRRQVEHEELQGSRLDPARGAIHLGEYAETWLAQRRRTDGRPLAPRTVELYRDDLRRRLIPAFGNREISSIRTDEVRAWHARIAAEVSPTQAAKAYRLLRAILNTAVEDDRIAINPCKVRGAGVERTAERPFVDADIVVRLAASIDDRYSALVLLAGFGGLRLGELLGLRRRDIDVARSQVRVEVQTVELRHGERLTTAPKTDAGRRTLHLPQEVTNALVRHLATYGSEGPDSLVFTGPLSEGLRRATFYKEWHRATAAAKAPGVHLHDLRHAAGTLAAQQGATIRELMARLGHASPQAAQRYQHAAERRDSVLAAALNEVLIHANALERNRSQTALRDECGMERPTGPGKTSEIAPDQDVSESERRESNPRSQLGKLMFCL